MADDNNFSIGDILWEYADYTPPEETAPPPSAPAPVQPQMPARAGQVHAPVQTPARTAPAARDFSPHGSSPSHNRSRSRRRLFRLRRLSIHMEPRIFAAVSRKETPAAGLSAFFFHASMRCGVT